MLRIALALMVTVMFVASPAMARPEKPHQEAAGPALGARDNPIYVAPAHELRDKGWAEKFWTDPNATFAGAVALFTLGLLVVSAWQG